MPKVTVEGTKSAPHTIDSTAGTVFCSTKWVKVDGVLYKAESAIVLEIVND